MIDMNKQVYLDIVKTIIGFLYIKDYEGVLNDDYAENLTSQEIETALTEYGGEVTIPPEDSYNKMNIYKVRDRDEVSIDFNLWIDNVESDLTLTVRIINVNGVPKYTIEGIHVL